MSEALFDSGERAAEDLDREPYASFATPPGYTLAREERVGEELERAWGGLEGAAGAGRRAALSSLAPHRVARWSAVATASGFAHAGLEIVSWPMRTPQGERSFGAVTLLGEHPSAGIVREPGLGIRLAHAVFAAAGRAGDYAVLFSRPGYEALRAGRKAGAPGHALDLEVLRTDAALEAPAERAGQLSAPHAEALSVRWLTPGDEAAVQAAEGLGLSEELLMLQPEAAAGAWLEGLPSAAACRIEDAAGSPRALARVSAKGAWLEALDWHCGPEDYEAGLTLLSALLARASTGGLGLRIELPEWHPWFLHLQWHGLQVLPGPGFTAVHVLERRFAAERLRTQWLHGGLERLLTASS